MRALAEYVMRGRTEATITAVLATGTVLFAWVGAAVIALVTLRKGLSQGSRILLWAMLPAVALAALGDTGPVTTLLGVALAAEVLRATLSWQWALVAGSVSALLTALLLVSFGKGYVEEVLQALSGALQQMVTQEQLDAGAQVVVPNALQVAGLLGVSNGLTVILCLMLARWWQAMLYNPGGFRAEFHRLRLSPSLTVGLLVAALAVAAMGRDYRLWALICILPLVFAGFGLVHGVVARSRLGTPWVVAFYVFWLILGPAKALLILLAVVDSWVDFRGRLPDKGAGAG